MAFQDRSLVVLVGNFVCHSPLYRNEKETHEKSGPKLNWAKTPGTVTWD